MSPAVQAAAIGVLALVCGGVGLWLAMRIFDRRLDRRFSSREAILWRGAGTGTAPFEPINLGRWRGREYVIPAAEVLPCIAQIEQVVSLTELGRMRVSGNLKLAQLARGLATAMRFAGAEVTDEELYSEMFRSDSDLSVRALLTLAAIESLMVPPEHLRKDPGSGKAEAARPMEASSPPASG